MNGLKITGQTHIWIVRDPAVKSETAEDIIQDGIFDEWIEALQFARVKPSEIGLAVYTDATEAMQDATARIVDRQLRGE